MKKFICIKMNQQYDSVISMIIYNVLLDMFKPILYIIKKTNYIRTCVISL
jgi:hypothetical protein